MANENLKAQKIYGKYIKELPQVTELNDTDDIIIEDSTPITSRAKLGVLFDSIKKRIASTWRFAELNNQTIVKYASELNSKSIIAQSGIDWIVERHGKYFEAYGVYSGYVSSTKLYAIDVPLPFTVDSLTVAFANPSYHAYYLGKWYVNETQTYSKSKLNLCFQTVNISSQTDIKFDLFIAGSCL